MSGLDLADYFNAGRDKDLSPPMLPSPPSHAASMAAGGTGLPRSISDGMYVTGGGEGSLAGGGGGAFGGTGGEGLRHRHVAGGREGEGMEVASGEAGAAGAAVAVAGAETNGFGGTAAGGSVRGGAGAGGGGAAFDVPPEGAVNAGVGGESSGSVADGSSGVKERGGGGAANGTEGPEGAASLEEERSRAGSMTTGALVGVFKGMMKERLVLVTFVLQAVRPAQDLAPLVALKFEGGASVLAGITSSRSLCRVLVPMTPLIPWLVRIAGGSSSAGATARMGGDRAVAAFMCVLMAGLAACVPAVGTLRELHHLMMFKGLCYIVRESTAGAVMARAAGTASVGAFFGWQHCIKGVQGTFSHFLTGWLSGYSISLPYYVVAFCDLVYAFAYLYI